MTQMGNLGVQSHRGLGGGSREEIGVLDPDSSAALPRVVEEMGPPPNSGPQNEPPALCRGRGLGRSRASGLPGWPRPQTHRGDDIQGLLGKVRHTPLGTACSAMAGDPSLRRRLWSGRLRRRGELARVRGGGSEQTRGAELKHETHQNPPENLLTPPQGICSRSGVGPGIPTSRLPLHRPDPPLQLPGRFGHRSKAPGLAREAARTELNLDLARFPIHLDSRVCSVRGRLSQEM